ncbi:hypothetical protein FEM08_03160 [Flavobacterium gilvum]|nr:hypothetical protein FEM08_03160 [Flavobacterium gilvum]
MRTTKYIASFMYFMVLFCFIVATVIFIISLSAKFFGNDGQYIYKYDDNSWTTIGNKNSEGSLVPVKLTLQIPDSIKINEKYMGIVAEDSYPSINNMFLKENKKAKAINLYDVAVPFPEGKKFQSISIEENGNYKNLKPSFKFIKYVNDGNTQYLSIKTGDSFTNIVLGLRSPINFLFYIMQMFFLAKILKELAKEIYFSKVLSKYISNLGFLMLFSQVIPLIYVFIDRKLFGNITITPHVLQSLKDGYFENIRVSFNPTVDMNIYIILLGAVLVLLTKLIKRGQTLEEENELTI